MAETPKTIQKQVVENIRRIVGDACEGIHKESDRLIRAMEWLNSMDLPPEQAVRPIDPSDQAPGIAIRVVELLCTCCQRMKPKEDLLDGVCSRCEANELAPKDTGSIPREWHSILYELLTYAYDNDRGSVFDYDFWNQCVQLVSSHKREPWPMDGVRAQTLLERIKAHVAPRESEDPAAGRCRGCDRFVRRRPDGKLHCMKCDPPEPEPKCLVCSAQISWGDYCETHTRDENGIPIEGRQETPDQWCERKAREAEAAHSERPPAQRNKPDCGSNTCRNQSSPKTRGYSQGSAYSSGPCTCPVTDHGDSTPQCKACGAEIYIGNCCNEDCTKVWLAEIEQAHRDKPKGKRFCRHCAQPHEMKSNYCGDCLCNVCMEPFPNCACTTVGKNQRRIMRP
jgi:hypothetical protein